MKVCILGDQHIGLRNDNLIFSDYFEKFYSEFFIPRLIEDGVTHIINLGDVFDRRKFVNFNTLERAKRYLFDPLMAANITMDIIIGNHDTFYRYTNDINSPELLLSHYPNIRIYKSAQEILLQDLPVLYVPWICAENATETYDIIKNTNAKFLFGHLEIQGYEHYRGHLSTDGESPEMFEKFQAVYSGHYHYKNSRNNIHYLGTPVQYNWQDYGERKGFHYFDTVTHELAFIENPYTIYEKFFYSDIDKDADYYLSLDYSQYTQKFVKVIVASKQNPFFLDLVVDCLEKAGVYDVSVVEGISVITDNLISEYDQSETTPKLIEKYINNMDIDISDKLKNFMFLLYNEAVNIR